MADLTDPPTAIETAALLHQLQIMLQSYQPKKTAVFVYDVARRLAFQRDRLVQELEEQKTLYDEMISDQRD
jgi:hypothetical protein